MSETQGLYLPYNFVNIGVNHGKNPLHRFHRHDLCILCFSVARGKALFAAIPISPLYGAEAPTLILYSSLYVIEV